MQVAVLSRRHAYAKSSLEHFIQRTAKALFLLIRKSEPSPRHHEIAQQNPPELKPYAPPAVRKLTLEQARLIVLGHSTQHDPGAQDLMHLLFPNDPDKTHVA